MGRSVSIEAAHARTAFDKLSEYDDWGGGLPLRAH